MNIVLDTNVLVVAISSKSDYRPIFDSFLREDYTLCVTTDILMEYEEVLGRYLGNDVSTGVLQLIENSLNVNWITRYYKWNLIKIDPDDNKFVDCAIACDAAYLVSDDRHFHVLRDISFPKVNLIEAKSFLGKLK